MPYNKGVGHGKEPPRHGEPKMLKQNSILANDSTKNVYTTSTGVRFIASASKKGFNARTAGSKAKMVNLPKRDYPTIEALCESMEARSLRQLAAQEATELKRAAWEAKKALWAGDKSVCSMQDTYPATYKGASCGVSIAIRPDYATADRFEIVVRHECSSDSRDYCPVNEYGLSATDAIVRFDSLCKSKWYFKGGDWYFDQGHYESGMEVL